MAELKDLIGKTMAAVELSNDDIVFTTREGERYRLYHDQDCFESVTVDSIVGDLSDLVGAPILLAEEVVHVCENPPGVEPPEDLYQESFTWTFYKFATRKGYVDIRWYGGSNGFYSERVSFERVVQA